MRKSKLWAACVMAAAMLALTACGKEDKLVLVTTEAASQSDATTTEVAPLFQSSCLLLDQNQV